MNKTIGLTLALAAAALAGTPKPLALPKPQTQGGMPLMQALQQRQSGRQFSPEQIPPQTLSNLLWAAFGVNRADGRRTAPSANNSQTIDIYVVTADGVYLYNPRAQRLEGVVDGDHRAATGSQEFVAHAPLNLVYVSDYSKMPGFPPETQTLFAGAETGFIAQNVYLFCASEGLATVVRATIDLDPLAKVLGLRPHQRITLAQSVGRPAPR